MYRKKRRDVMLALCFIAVTSLTVLGCNQPTNSDEDPSPPPSPSPSWTPKAGYINIPLNELDPAAFYGNGVGYRDEYYTNDGTEAEPMRVLIAPWVYWCDDRDDPVIASTEGKSLYGMEIEKTWLRLEGLANDPDNLILCGNRGQYNGSQGNWTLFRIQGDGLYVQNLTIANYCSVDLIYSLNHELDYPQ